MNPVTVGQIYRDTYYDGRLNQERKTHRTIRIQEIVGDKAIAETLTDIFGETLAKPRKTRVSLKTLQGNYVLVTP